MELEEAEMRYWRRLAKQEDGRWCCGICGEVCEAGEAEVLGGQVICLWCEVTFCQEQFNAQGPAFLKAHQREFLDWWMEGLEEKEQTRMLKVAYCTEKEKEGPAYREEWEKDFCFQSDDWQDFIKEQL